MTSPSRRSGRWPDLAGTVLKYEKNSWVECRTHKHTPLWAAARNGHTSTVLVLLQAGARVDAKDKLNGATPLSVAAEYGHKDNVLTLLQAGARVDAKDKWGETALDIAKEKQHAEVVAILRAAGARE